MTRLDQRVQKLCRHPHGQWRHVHYRISDQPFCRLECRCGYVIDEGRTR